MTGEIELTADRTVLSMPDDLPIEDWAALGRRLCSYEQRVQWWLGDWWAFGDHRFGARAAAVAEGVFGRSFKTLANVASVARQFPPSRRRDLPFTHHAEVAALPPEKADRILDAAVANRWSSRDVRQEAARAAQETTARLPDHPEPPRAYQARKFQRLSDMMRSALSDWFGVGDVYAGLLMALFAAGGATIPPRSLAVAVDSHRPMSTGALHEAISSLRKVMDAEAIDRNDDGYCLSEVGLRECRQAIREEASAMAAFGLEPANDLAPTYREASEA